MNIQETVTYTREQLHKLVWGRPISRVALALGVSDVGLAKICRKFHIPRPWRGYWRELETGHKPRQPKLPAWPAHLGPEPQAITFHPTARAASEAAPPRLPEPDSVRRQRAYESAPEHCIAVAVSLTEPDRLVRRAARLLTKPGDRNLLWPRERPCLDIQVTKDSLDRALRVFDAILNAIRTRGWAVKTQEERPFQTQVTVLDEFVAVCITEKVRQVERPHSPKKEIGYLLRHERYAHEPTGLLTIRLTDGPSFAWNARTWSDGKRQRVEACLHDVMIGFVQLAERQKEARRTEEQRRLEWAEAERRRLSEAQRAEREKDRREELKRQMEVWLRAGEVRAYVTALKEAARDSVAAQPDGRLARWLRWAEAYAGLLDPLTRVEALPLDPHGYGRVPLELDSWALGAPGGHL